VCFFICAALVILKRSGGSEEEKSVTHFPQKINFAGEQAPLESEDVNNHLDRELIVI
jgi:hypothetical protein